MKKTEGKEEKAGVCGKGGFMAEITKGRWREQGLWVMPSSCCPPQTGRGTEREELLVVSEGFM